MAKVLLLINLGLIVRYDLQRFLKSSNLFFLFCTKLASVVPTKLIYYAQVSILILLLLNKNVPAKYYNKVIKNITPDSLEDYLVYRVTLVVFRWC